MLPRLQFLTLDTPVIGHVQQARLACEGGVRWVQFRTKALALPEWTRLARQVVEVCHAHGALCTLNDSPDIALASGADGVHLGRSDAAPAAARAMLGDAALVGVTLNHMDDLTRLRAGRPDYVGVGPFRATATKPGHAPVHTAESLRTLALASALPAYAIGGVGEADLPALAALGLHGIAVSSAIAQAADPRAAARALVDVADRCWASA